jgi:hypothetical protein
METYAQMPKHKTTPAPPPIPEFELREIELDDDGYMIEAPYRYYGIGKPVWKVIGENNDNIILRASSEKAARKRIARVLEHFINNTPGLWPDWDILPNDVEEFV